MEHSKADLLVIAAADLVQKTSDIAHEFYQERNFLYLTGINEPSWVLVMDCVQKKEWLIRPKANRYLSLFDGRQSDAIISQISNIEKIVTNRAGWKELSALCSRRKRVGTILVDPRYAKIFGMRLDPSLLAIKHRLQRRSAQPLLSAAPEIRLMRQVKDEYEIALMRKAIGVTGDALRTVKAQFSTYKSEHHVLADISKIFIAAGSTHGYTPIVAAGSNATIMHYLSTGNRLQKGNYVLIDVGAEIDHYTADVSRTYAYGAVTDRHKEIYAAVAHVQSFAKSILSPAISLLELEERVEQEMGQVLQQLGLIRTINRQTVRTYFPTATSHFLGLEPHDAGSYREPLRPGSVVTVEPGIYVPNEGIGVRIEDDILITASGIENISEGID